MKLQVSIPLITVFVLLLTFSINILGLQYLLKKYFPQYLESVKTIEGQHTIDEANLKAFWKTNDLKKDVQEDYQKAIEELSFISSSLNKIAENPELYLSNKSLEEARAPSLQNLGQYSNELLFDAFFNPLKINFDSPEGKFIITILGRLLAINVIWIIVITAIYIIWIGKIFRPIQYIITSLKNFSHSHGQNLEYKRKDEFYPLIQSLNAFRQSLDRQEAIRNTLLSDISHEIRTPITAVSCVLDAINDKLMEVNPETINILQKEMQRLISITQGIMEHEKFLQSTEDETQITPMHPSEIHKEILLQYKQLFEPNHQKFIDKIPENLTIPLNKEHYSQLIHNIFSNFYKYAGKNSTLTVTYTEDKNSYILQFSDNGNGVKPEDMPFVSEKFFRSDTGRNQNNELSMGIGLSIIKKIMSLHKGIMEIEHNQPQGFIIILTFPKND